MSEADRLGLARTHPLGSLADGWQRAGDERIFKVIVSPMEYSASSKKLIGRVLLTVKTSAPAPFNHFLRRPRGIWKLSDTTERWGVWSRGDLAPGNVVTIDSLRSSPDKLYAALVGGDTDVLVDDKALGSIARRMRTMGLAVSDSDKGWIGQFNAALRSRSGERMKSLEY